MPCQDEQSYCSSLSDHHRLHSHVGSQTHGKVRQRHVDVFLRQFFPDGLQGDFQLISHLRLRLEFMVLYQLAAWCPKRGNPAGSNLESLGPLIPLSETGTVRLILYDA